MFKLRYYQTEAILAVLKVWEEHQAAIIVAATGTGKTEIYLAMAVSDPGRAVVIGHRDYLLYQPIARLQAHGFDDIAVEKADQRSEGMLSKAKIVFASVQSLCKPERLATFDPNQFSLVIIDEGHRSTAATYRRIIEHFRRNPRIRFLILTATPKRKDNIALGNLCDGDIAVAFVYGPKIASDEGWIVPLRFYRREVEGLDFSHVAMKGADLNPEQVEALLIQEKPLHIVCASLAEDTGPTILFCPGVAVARAYATLMDRRYRPGRATCLWADSPDEEREEAGKRMAQGELDYIFNVDLFTEGYDLPELARVVWAAPTASLVRFTQGTGRVFRTHSSLRNHLSGSKEEAIQRRLLIEQSPKPFGQIVTYYPQNCRHQLCEPNDILGGDELPPELRSAAKMIQETTAAQPGGSDPEEDVKTAQAFIELRSLIDAKRRHIKAKAEVSDVEYDGFAGHRATGQVATETREAAKTASDSWPNGHPATPAQRTWLRHHGVPNADQLDLTKWRAIIVRDLIELGVKSATALSYGKRQALAVKASIQKKRGSA